MLIVSPDGNQAFNIDYISLIDVIRNGCSVSFTYAETGAINCEIFHYDTQEEAKETLRNLAAAYKNGEKVFEMPERGYLADFKRRKDMVKYLDADLKVLKKKKILSARSVNALCKAGFNTLRSAVTIAEEQIASIPGIGEGCVNEIVSLVHECGGNMAWEE